MIRNYIERLQRGSEVIILILSVLALILFLYISLSRLTYPFDLEWCEGSLLDHAYRIIDGKPYYNPPAPDFIPTAYPPVYYYIIVFIWKILGVNMWSVRLLSILSTLLIALIIILISRRYKVSYIYSFAAAGFFLSCFKVTGSWFDLARIDMISLLFFMIALYWGLTKEGCLGIALSGLLAGLSCMTKQNFIILSMIIPLSFALQKRWKAIICFLLPFTILISSMMLILHMQTNGWSGYYIYSSCNVHTLNTIYKHPEANIIQRLRIEYNSKLDPCISPCLSIIKERNQPEKHNHPNLIPILCISSSIQ